MRKAFFILVVIYLVVCAGCCPCRQAGTASAVVDRDSVYVTRYDTLRIVERDTLVLRPLLPSHDHIITRKQYSQLDNAYCTSTAEIDTEGLLRHSLDTKDSALMPVRVQRVEHIVRDTVVRRRVDNRTEVCVKEVVRSAWYDKFIRVACIGLLAVVLIQNRKWIGKLIGLWRI